MLIIILLLIAIYAIIGLIVYENFPWGKVPKWEKIWSSAFWPCLAILQVVRWLAKKF